MEQRQLGGSGLKVSALTLGTMTFGGEGHFAPVGDTQLEGARRMVERCREAGVTLFDTANAYSGGRSEEILGEALAEVRDEVLIATKVFYPMGEGPNETGHSRHHVLQQCDASLRRLGTDRIDLYQLHNWDGLTPLEETLGALQHLVDQGKVRYVGCSNYAAWQMTKALGIADVRGLPRFVTTQNFYSPAFRDVEFEIVPAALDAGVGMLVWSPLAGGLTSGKYRRDSQPEGGRHLTEWDEPPVYDEEGLYDVVDVLVEVGDEHGVSAARVSLAWLLTRPAVASIIVGARTEEQLADNLAAASLELTDDQVDRIERASRPDLPYPFWHQRMTAAHRYGPGDEAVPRLPGD